MSNTVTSELRKSISKFVEDFEPTMFYSDSRKKGLAVGVKVCYAEFEDEIKKEIIDDMESKGFKLAYVRYNKSPYGPGPYNSIPGTRFCFYKK